MYFETNAFSEIRTDQNPEGRRTLLGDIPVAVLFPNVAA